MTGNIKVTKTVHQDDIQRYSVLQNIMLCNLVYWYHCLLPPLSV